MRQWIALILLGFGLIWLGGCGACAEREELGDDVERWVHKKDHEQAMLAMRIERFAKENILMAQRLPLEAERFLEWRKRELWRLNDQFAWMILNQWQNVDKLTKEVGRYYGYNIVNFPNTVTDIEGFFLRATPEWRNLVMDVMVFIEFHAREQVPLTEDIARFYAAVDWEAANLEIDVRQFLEWREREYKKLIRNGKDYFAHAKVELGRMKESIYRFQTRHLVEGKQITADFENFFMQVGVEVPRLVDEVWHFMMWREREWAKMVADQKRMVAEMNRDVDSLVKDIERFHAAKDREARLVMLDIDRFFHTYEREVRPLKEEVKRFWRYNISMQYLLADDVKRFYQNSVEEAAELEQDLQRFISYGKYEWKTLGKRLKYHFTCEFRPGFGDPVLPIRGDLPGRGFNDHTPVPSPIENTGY